MKCFIRPFPVTGANILSYDSGYGRANTACGHCNKAIDLIDEASKTRLDAYVMPDEIKTLEAQIEQLTKDKEEAIKSEAYEQAEETVKEKRTA